MNTSVSFQVAKLLKEKGFDEKVRGRIHVSHWHLVKNNIIPSNVNTYHTDMFAPLDNWNNNKQHFMSMPTIAEVVMWLYEKHSIWVQGSFPYNNGKWGWVIFLLKEPLDNTDGYKNIMSLHHEPYWFNAPTEANEAAIEYILNNLI